MINHADPKTCLQQNQAGTSGDIRQYHDQNYGYDAPDPHETPGLRHPETPIPAKNYSPKTELQNNSQQITVTVETGKDNTRDAPKNAKSVSKTYHTLKDMISSRFKSKENNESEKEPEANLNNSEERKREPEPTRETPTRKVEQGIYGRPITQNRPDMQYSHNMANNMAYPSPSPHRLDFTMIYSHSVQMKIHPLKCYYFQFGTIQSKFSQKVIVPTEIHLWPNLLFLKNQMLCCPLEHEIFNKLMTQTKIMISSEMTYNWS